MKIRAVIILIVATTLGAGVSYRFLSLQPLSKATEKAPAEHNVPQKEAKPPLEPEPIPLPVEKVEIPSVEETPPEVKPQPKPAPEQRQAAARYWDAQAKRFAALLAQLDQEQDTAKRLNLIRNLAGFVRIDTPAALDWAMGLEDPEEKRAALEAINEYALSGIGAKIEVDETGYPKIKDTTVLSAIASTGLVEPGDYILGMLDANGQPFYFKDLPFQKIIEQLRGQPGSEIQLLMERAPADGGEAHAFHVTVQRSMLVVQPPY